jgi:hypothetical protein
MLTPEWECSSCKITFEFLLPDYWNEKYVKRDRRQCEKDIERNGYREGVKGKGTKKLNEVNDEHADLSGREV